ncbi:hypothetical protein J3E74DRAFT_366177, partial [Bipolaris maydis]
MVVLQLLQLQAHRLRVLLPKVALHMAVSLLKVLQLRVPPLRALLTLVLPVPVLPLRATLNLVPLTMVLLPKVLLEPVPQAPQVQALPHSLSPLALVLPFPCPPAVFPPSPCPLAVSPAAQADQAVTLPTPAVLEARVRTASLAPVDFSSGSAVSSVRARARVLAKARVREKATANPRATTKWLGLNDYPWAYRIHLTD